MILFYTLLVWGCIALFKYRRIRDIFAEHDDTCRAYWKRFVPVVYKNPYLFLVIIGCVYSLFFDSRTPHSTVFLYGGLYYFIPMILFLIIIRITNRNTDAGSKIHVRGTSLTDADLLSKALAPVIHADAISVTAQIRIPRKYETTHFFAIGRPGCGKSQLFYRVIQTIIARGDKALVYEFKGDLVAKFYNPDRDILFNPLDTRCVAWNIFNEIESVLAIRSIANSLIPVHGTDPYWSTAARDVFCGILTALFHAGKRTNAAVHTYCNLPVRELHAWLSHYPGTETATRHLSQEKAGASILSVLSSATQSFEFLKTIDGDFSIRQWASDDSDRRRVFLTNYSEISDTIRPILSLFIELAGKRVLSLPDTRDRRFFFFIDEFGTLNPLSSIPTMLTNGRSKGMSIWVAVQDLGQIEKLYGRELAQTIINACATNFIFAVNDPYNAEYISKKIGEREIRQVNVSYTSGHQASSSTTSYQTMNERVVLPSEILNLPDLVFFFKLPDFNATPLRLHIVSIPNSQPSFIARPELRIIPHPAPVEVTANEFDAPVPPLKKPRYTEDDEYHL